jgi:snurportin-1
MCRFWWRDTRLAELTQTPPPSFHFVASTSPSASSSTNTQSYHFPYPTTFVSVPYHTDTSLSALNSQIIPSARAWRMIHLQMPSTGIYNDVAFDSGSNRALKEEDKGGMEVEASLTQPQLPSHSEIIMHPPPATFKTQMPASTARVQPDGMLLYVAEASYEPGTSPLSSWVPICLDPTAHGTKVEVAAQDINSGEGEGPLETFQRCVFFADVFFSDLLLVAVGL